MKRPPLALALLAFVVLCAPPAPAITADQLAQFLGVSSWSTTVDLPANSFTADIFEIADGQIGEPWLRGGEWSAKNPEAGLTLIVGPRDQHYRITMQHGGGVHGVVTKVPLLDSTFSSAIPAKIGEGDFIFFGQANKDGSQSSNNPGSYTRGFLLRVKKFPPAAKEDAKALRCLANAKIIATACKLFAVDHDGRYPTKFDELFPDYLATREHFTSPLAPTPGEFGYELLGGQETDAPDTVLLRGRFPTSDGRRSIVYVNQWGALEWR